MKPAKILFTFILILTIVLGVIPAGLTVAALDIPFVSQTEEIPFQSNPRYRDVLTERDICRLTKECDPTDVTVHSSTTFKSEADAVEQIREYMKDRVEEFSIRLEIDAAGGKAILKRMMEKAVEHTGDPQEGDYLAWQYAGWSADIEQHYWGYAYDYTFKISVSYYTTAEQEAEVDTAVEKLLKDLNVSKKNNYQKISAVYDYICQNVTYDYENLEDDDYMLKHTAYAALVDKTAVCQGYAVLMYRLLLELDVDNRVIVGVSGDEDHAWNIAQIGDLYYNLDATWDAGESEYAYFLRCRENFVGHIRYLEYESMDFHTDYPMSSTDYAQGGSAKVDPIIAKGICGDDASWSLGRDGALTITGNGAIYDYPYSGSQEYKAPWEYWEEEITKLTVGKGITRIGNYNFCDMYDLTSVSLPDTLKEIGTSAFAYDSSLKKITIPDGVMLIDSDVFKECTTLTSITIPDSVTTIGVGCFQKCTALKTVSLSANLTAIPIGLFSACSELESIVIPQGVTIIGEGAFSGCSSLEQITIPASVVQVAQRTFQYCTNLEKVVFEGSPSLGLDIFEYGEGALKKVWFNGDAPTFHVRTFAGVTATCYYPKDNATWTADVLLDYDGTLTWVASCGNNHTEVTDPAVAPTCTETGLTEGSHCSDCGEVLVEQKTVDATGHDYQKKVTAPTCSSEGYTTNTCSVCGNVKKTDYVDPLAHSYGDWEEVKAPTVEAEGLAERTCADCGHTDQKTLAKLDPPDSEPTETEPVETEPAPTDPPVTDPAETEPVQTEPVDTEPTETQPDATLPGTTAPVQTQPQTTAPDATEDASQSDDSSGGWIIPVVVIVLALGAVATVVIMKRKK